MPHIREMRWKTYYDEDGTYYKPELQQRNDNCGTWEAVPIIEIKSKDKEKWQEVRRKNNDKLS